MSNKIYKTKKKSRAKSRVLSKRKNLTLNNEYISSNTKKTMKGGARPPRPHGNNQKPKVSKWKNPFKPREIGTHERRVQMLAEQHGIKSTSLNPKTWFQKPSTIRQYHKTALKQARSANSNSGGTHDYVKQLSLENAKKQYSTNNNKNPDVKKLLKRERLTPLGTPELLSTTKLFMNRLKPASREEEEALGIKRVKKILANSKADTTKILSTVLEHHGIRTPNRSSLNTNVQTQIQNINKAYFDLEERSKLLRSLNTTLSKTNPNNQFFETRLSNAALRNETLQYAGPNKETISFTPSITRGSSTNEKGLFRSSSSRSSITSGDSFYSTKSRQSSSSV